MAKQTKTDAPVESARGILDCEICDEALYQQLKECGIPPTTLNAIYLTMGKKAAAGDVQAAKYLRDVMQEQSENGEETAEMFRNLTNFSDQTLRRLAAKWEDE